MTVSLVSLPERAPPIPPAARAHLNVLAAKHRTDGDPVPSAPAKDRNGPLDQLVERLQHETALPVRTQPEPLHAAPPSPPREATAAPETPAKPGPPASGPSAGGAASGGLWGQIQPCWRNLGGRVTVPVSLEVVLDARGHLAKAPTILRGGAALDERRLTAEAAALQALGACLPQADLRFGGQTYQLNFPPG